MLRTYRVLVLSHTPSIWNHLPLCIYCWVCLIEASRRNTEPSREASKPNCIVHGLGRGLPLHTLSTVPYPHPPSPALIARKIPPTFRGQSFPRAVRLSSGTIPSTDRPRVDGKQSAPPVPTQYSLSVAEAKGSLGLGGEVGWGGGMPEKNAPEFPACNTNPDSTQWRSHRFKFYSGGVWLERAHHIPGY